MRAPSRVPYHGGAAKETRSRDVRAAFALQDVVRAFRAGETSRRVTPEPASTALTGH